VDVEPKIGEPFPPPNSQIIRFNGVFHYFHHPFWGTPIFGNTHVVSNWMAIHGDGSISLPPCFDAINFQAHVMKKDSDGRCGDLMDFSNTGGDRKNKVYDAEKVHIFCATSLKSSLPHLQLVIW